MSGLSKRKYLTSPTADKGICSLYILLFIPEVVASGGQRNCEIVKLPINKTVFTDLLMASQRHRDIFTAPIPFTYHHGAASKPKLPRLASEAKAKTSEQRAAILMKPSHENWVRLQSRNGLLISCNLVCWKSMDSRLIKITYGITNNNKKFKKY